jgi:hypothetical protein
MAPPDKWPVTVPCMQSNCCYNSPGKFFFGGRHSKHLSVTRLYSPRLLAMNKLFIGFSKQIPRPKGPFLLIDDEVPKIPLAQVFDPKRYSLDPLRRISARQARDLAEVLYTTVPQGAATLTVRNGRRALAPALLTAKRFDLVRTDNEEALAMIDDLLFLLTYAPLSAPNRRYLPSSLTPSFSPASIEQKLAILLRWSSVSSS